MRTRSLAALAAACSMIAAAPAAEAATYKGRTEGGGRISFSLSGGTIGRVTGAVPTVCLETMGSYQSRSGVELYQPPGAFRLGRTAQVKALQPAAMNRGIKATKNYTVSARRSGGKVKGKLKVNLAFFIPDLFRRLPYTYICSGSTSFSAKAR